MKIVPLFSYRYCRLAITVYIKVDEVGFIPSGMFAKKFVNYSTSLQTISRAINSYFIIDITIIVCLTDFHVITLTSSANT